jgi:hypothetical protein
VTTDEIVAANNADFANGTTTIYPAQELFLPAHASTQGGGALGPWAKGAVAVALIGAAVIYKTNSSKSPPT